MEIKIKIPQLKEQRVLNGYDVDNEADLKTAIILEIKEHIRTREYKKAIQTAKESLVDITFN